MLRENIKVKKKQLITFFPRPLKEIKRKHDTPSRRISTAVSLRKLSERAEFVRDKEHVVPPSVNYIRRAKAYTSILNYYAMYGESDPPLRYTRARSTLFSRTYLNVYTRTQSK